MERQGALDEAALAWLGRPVFPPRTVLYAIAATLAVAATWSVQRAEAVAASRTLDERARALISELEAETSTRELLGSLLMRAREALAAAAAVPETESAEVYRGAALEWAEAARELRRAHDAEVAADRLEREASALQTELAEARAAVEQAMARVGRARQQLTELEARSGKPTTKGTHAAPRDTTGDTPQGGAVQDGTEP